MFEQRMTRIERIWAELRWLMNPGRPFLTTLGHQVRTVIGWFVLGALLMLLAVVWYAHAVPGDVVATDARMEDKSPRHHVYSIGVAHRGVEVRCLFVVYRLEQNFTLSC